MTIYIIKLDGVHYTTTDKDWASSPIWKGAEAVGWRIDGFFAALAYASKLNQQR